MNEAEQPRPPYGSKVLATIAAKRERQIKRAEKMLANLKQMELAHARLEQQIDDADQAFRRKAVRAHKRVAEQRKNQHFAWGTLIERELLADRLDADHWRAVLTRVFGDDPAELSRATLGLEMRASVDQLPRYDRQVWRLRWGIAVEHQLQSGALLPEHLALRVERTLDTLDHRRALAGIERVAGRRVEVPDIRARGELSAAHVARVALAAGKLPVEAVMKLAAGLLPSDRDAVLHGLAARPNALSPNEIMLFEQGLSALIDKWITEGLWKPERMAGLVEHLRRIGALV